MVTFSPPVAPLFVPADRPERFEKAVTCGADAVVFDLEDAVSPQNKTQARSNLGCIPETSSFKAFVRINSSDTQWFLRDLEALVQLPFAGVLLPKVQFLSELAIVKDVLGRDCPVIALIETAAGVAALQDICTAPNLAQLAFGSVDYALDMNCQHMPEALQFARMQLTHHSRVAGLPAPLDGVTTAFKDPDINRKDAALSASMGFGGKLAIHPTQVPIILDAFRPTPDQLNWARSVVDADKSGDGTAIQLNGQMIDAPVVRRAKRILQSVDQG